MTLHVCVKETTPRPWYVGQFIPKIGPETLDQVTRSEWLVYGDTLGGRDKPRDMVTAFHFAATTIESVPKIR